MSDDPTLYELMDGTSEEKNLAGDYVAVIDKLSALTGAVEDGNWYRAFDKIESMRRALDDLERRISTRVEDEDGEVRRVFARPDADPQRTYQLIIAFAQQYGGRLGTTLYPVEGLGNEAAKEKIARSKKWSADFRAALNASDAAAASRLTGRTVRIVDGMTSGGGQ
ncbi:hypothetical protein [Streptomyces sp. DH12]|uniref:hypothetical protein n=1 Tax=Streptomyces sp. DH12 TaxID=2857010 RepID=UPI001E4E2370|nr:hypothetical protein [Streptomyces sp. DH12]